MFPLKILSKFKISLQMHRFSAYIVSSFLKKCFGVIALTRKGKLNIKVYNYP